MCSNTGTPNNHHFLFGTNGKVVVLGVPILKHFRVDPTKCHIMWRLIWAGTVSLRPFYGFPGKNGLTKMNECL